MESSTTVFNTDSNKKSLLSTKSAYLSHVTLKTGVMAA